MSKDKKPAPAESGNPAVRTWPTEVNASGVIIGSPIVVEAKEKKKYVKVTAAFVVEAGKIGVVLGLDYKSPDGVGGGGHATSVTGVIYSTPKDALEMIGDYFKRAQIPFTFGTASDDFANGLTQAADVHAQVEALGVTEDELMAWMEAGEQPESAESTKPAHRILAKGPQRDRYEYTDAELAEFSREQARLHREIAEIEGQKKRANDQFKQELEEVSVRLEGYFTKSREGYEMRQYPCTTYADMPTKGQKSVIRDDTGKVLRVTAMTHADLQEELALTDARKGNDTGDENTDEGVTDGDDDNPGY